MQTNIYIIAFTIVNPYISSKRNNKKIQIVDELKFYRRVVIV